MIRQEAAAPGDLDQPEVLNRSARLQARVLVRPVRTSLIVVAEDHESDAARADVADVESEVLRKLPLDSEVPGLDVAGPEIRRNVVGAHIDLLDVVHRQETVRIALLCRAKTGLRRLR